MEDVMCYVIDAENLILNCFVNHSDINEVSGRSLMKLKSKIEKTLGPSVYVDITANSIRSTVIKMRDCLGMEPTRVVLSNGQKFHEKWNADRLEDQYNWRIPPQIKKKYIQAVTDEQFKE